ncbi:hypothetical protein B9Z19DRAFT_1193493 [Tuber borchii]|uniref:Uncharacterized protein n=1 Tax=Tuber borchii TaxID=42251 RepID=A0A2T6ZRV8_TUBBO|nr:hypothetical protein B9Z19DRAFT_1193493 [Tuber borchii]
MKGFLKSPTRFAASLRTGRFRYPIHRQSRRTPTTMLAYSEALEKLEAKWFKRCLDQRGALLKVLKESEARSFKRSEEEHARMFNQLEDQVKSFHNQRTALLKHFDVKQQLHEKKVEELVQQNCDLLDAALDERTVRMKSQGKYNACGALERMVYLSQLQKKVPPTAGIQQGLDRLAQGDEFTTILHKEVEARKLGVKDVMACIDYLYERVSHRTNGNDNDFHNTIIVRALDYNDYEMAALVIFLKVQSNWPNPLKWKALQVVSRKTHAPTPPPFANVPKTPQKPLPAPRIIIVITSATALRVFVAALRVFVAALRVLVAALNFSEIPLMGLTPSFPSVNSHSLTLPYTQFPSSLPKTPSTTAPMIMPGDRREGGVRMDG